MDAGGLGVWIYFNETDQFNYINWIPVGIIIKYMGNNKLLKNKLTLILLGRSGSGKGTQAKFILRRFKSDGVYYVSTGQMLRVFIKKNNNVSRLAARVLKDGKLIPAWLVSYLWSKKLVERGYINGHLVFDGAPRRSIEAELLDDAMAWYGRLLPICIYLDVDSEEVTKRLLARARHDDTPFVIKNRLAYFPKDVLPVIRYYKTRRRLIHINGQRPIKEVWSDIDKALAKRMGKRWPLGI